MCPDKNKGPKCFACNTFGHKSNDPICPRKTSKQDQRFEKKPSVNVLVAKNRAEKLIELIGKRIMCNFDTGSDINVIQLKTCKQMHLPRYNREELPFETFGSNNTTLGHVWLTAVIDECTFQDVFFIVRDQPTLPKILVGLSLINQMKLTITPNGIKVEKLNNINEMPTMNDQKSSVDTVNSVTDEMPFVNCVYEKEKSLWPDVNHIEDKVIRSEVNKLIRNYKPDKIRESPIQLKIILKDDIPVYQRARRLPPQEKALIDQQIKEWLQAGIIRPSVSDYA